MNITLIKKCEYINQEMSEAAENGPGRRTLSSSSETTRATQTKCKSSIVQIARFSPPI